MVVLTLSLLGNQKKAQRYGNTISEVTPNVENIGWKILYAVLKYIKNRRLIWQILWIIPAGGDGDDEWPYLHLSLVLPTHISHHSLSHCISSVLLDTTHSWGGCTLSTPGCCSAVAFFETVPTAAVLWKLRGGGGKVCFTKPLQRQYLSNKNVSLFIMHFDVIISRRRAER